MWPDWASRQLEISPWTEMSVKFLARRSRILPVSSLTVKVLRSGMRLKVSCSVILSSQWSVLSCTPTAGGRVERLKLARWKFETGGGYTPPIKMHKIENKRVAGKAFCKCMKVKEIDDGKNAGWSKG